MFEQLSQLLKRPLGKLIAVELFIFVVVGILSLIFRFPYSLGLIGAGAITMIMWLATTNRSPHYLNAPTQYHEAQVEYIREVSDPARMKKRFALQGELILIGFIPLAAGAVLSLLGY